MTDYTKQVGLRHHQSRPWEIVNAQNQGKISVAVSGAVTLTPFQATQRQIHFSGTGGTVTFPTAINHKMVSNDTSGNVTITAGGATDVVVPTNKLCLIGIDLAGNVVQWTPFADPPTYTLPFNPCVDDPDLFCFDLSWPGHDPPIPPHQQQISLLAGDTHSYRFNFGFEASVSAEVLSATIEVFEAPAMPVGDIRGAVSQTPGDAVGSGTLPCSSAGDVSLTTGFRPTVTKLINADPASYCIVEENTDYFFSIENRAGTDLGYNIKVSLVTRD